MRNLVDLNTVHRSIGINAIPIAWDICISHKTDFLLVNHALGIAMAIHETSKLLENGKYSRLK